MAILGTERNIVELKDTCIYSCLPKLQIYCVSLRIYFHNLSDGIYQCNTSFSCPTALRRRTLTFVIWWDTSQLQAMSHLHKIICWIWRLAACTCRKFSHSQRNIFVTKITYYSSRFSLQESNQERRLPSPPEIEYGDWSAKNVEETEFQRTARILGVLFPAPPISSATPISGMANTVAERRSAQGYGSPDPSACYLEVMTYCWAKESNSIQFIPPDFLLSLVQRGLPFAFAQQRGSLLWAINPPGTQEKKVKWKKIGIQIPLLRCSPATTDHAQLTAVGTTGHPGRLAQAFNLLSIRYDGWVG